MIEWNRSETLALAMHQCSQCHGSGLRLARKGALAPCNCVLRSIFRICYGRFQKCVTQERHLSRTSLEAHAGRSRPEVGDARMRNTSRTLRWWRAGH